jgi:uncharacterized protein YbaR (Trm112 family)
MKFSKIQEDDVNVIANIKESQQLPITEDGVPILLPDMAIGKHII